jgi:DNA-binding FrmR family transcriptional regulator
MQYKKRIHTLQGQLSAIEKMMETEVSCTDVVVQLKAVRSGVSSLLVAYLEYEAQACVTSGARNKKDLQKIIKVLAE